MQSRALSSSARARRRCIFCHRPSWRLPFATKRPLAEGLSASSTGWRVRMTIPNRIDPGAPMFVTCLSFAQNRATAPAFMAAHIAGIAQGFAEEVSCVRGRFSPPNLLHKEARTENDVRMAADQFVMEGVVPAETLEVDANLTTSALELLKADASTKTDGDAILRSWHRERRAYTAPSPPILRSVSRFALLRGARCTKHRPDRYRQSARCRLRCRQESG
ncbi:hypothetical protein SHLA_47c000520 [Shinella sp. DD12]|nr:hypothetical protein SHLA_47c000520 [Shinella sp. DD12]